jgi:hypothetical protein
MKKTIIHTVAALFLLLIAAPLFAVQRNAVDEVIRMAKAGVSEDTMLEYVAKTDANFEDCSLRFERLGSAAWYDDHAYLAGHEIGGQSL